MGYSHTHNDFLNKNITMKQDQALHTTHGGGAGEWLKGKEHSCT